MKQFGTLVFISGLLILAGAALYVRLADLGQFTTADEIRWHTNVNNFTTALAHAEFSATYQLPHPGITLQWLAAPTATADSWGGRKLSLVTAQSILVLLTGYVFYQLWGRLPAVFIVLLLAFNPILVAHTRVYAMDSLLGILLLLSAGCLLLWNTTNEIRYLLFSGIAGALAALSKLPGIIIVPFSLLLLMYWHRSNPRVLLKYGAMWLASFIITLPIVLPALAVRPLATIQNLFEFFSSDDYTELHPASNWYYARTLIFFSTPVQMAAIILLPFMWKKISAQQKEHAAFFLLFAAAFVLMMSLGSKMGDRYILPVFLLLDAVAASVAAIVITPLFKRPRKADGLRLIAYGFVVLFVWQAVDVIRLHPYELAYVNPLTKPFFGERRLGWGEGLDIAAAYLNAKPDRDHLTVASYYPNQFGEYFQGRAIELHEWNNGGSEYAVLYRAQFERGKTAWETDVLTQFKSRIPEKVIMLNGLEYVWIYNVQSN